MLKNLKWEEKKWQGPRQFAADSFGTELMMLPVRPSLAPRLYHRLTPPLVQTDYALLDDPKFRPWVDKYADDKDAFFSDFAKVFAKLVELGVHRDEHGSYEPAPQKSGQPGAPSKVGRDREAEPVRHGNELRARL